MTEGSGGTAQARFADMLRLEIASELRSLGFTGSGARYVLPDDDRWLLVGFQKDRYNRADTVRFTVNLTAVGRKAWTDARAGQPWLPEQPSGNAHYPVDGLQVIRLGSLLPPREDRWWEVTTSRGSTRVSAEVLAAIEQAGLPWLRRS
jgi:hypothetical protein